MNAKIKSIPLLFLLLIGSPAGAQSEALGVVGNQNSRFMPLKTLGVSEVKWTDGFWGKRAQQFAEVMVPQLGAVMSDPDRAHAFQNFQIAAGLESGMFKGQPYHDGDFYKYVEAMVYAYALTGEQALDLEMDSIIEVIAKAQRDDGYLHTKIQIGHGIQGFPRLNTERKFKVAPLTSAVEHEFYNFGHLFTAACVHHRVTGKRNFLDIAIKAADLLYDTFINPSPALARVDWNPPHYMGLIELYRTTGDQRYVELVDVFVDMLGTAPAMKGDGRGMDQSQRRTAFREESEAVGHAGHANYLYCGVADLVAETGDSELRMALDRIWHDVVERKMYLTGATGQHHYTISKNGDYVSEAYGAPFDLPNISAYNETCANIGNAMWNWRMLLLTGDAHYADVMETVFYNSALSGISLDGQHFFYTNPLRFIEGHPLNTKDGGIRKNFMPVFCCPPNIVRTVGKLHTYAYCKSEDGIWVNLFGSSEMQTELAHGIIVKVIQKTDYPWGGDVSFEIGLNEPSPFTLHLRIPAWAEGAQLRINDQDVDVSIEPGDYVELSRIWEEGDRVFLQLPMQPNMVTSHPWVEGNRNQVAVRRGPVVYCLESVDLPESVSLLDVQVPSDSEWNARFDADLLGGTTVLEGDGLWLKRSAIEHSLYDVMAERNLQPVNLRLIPYFAWANRGTADMSVWLPIACCDSCDASH